MVRPVFYAHLLAFRGRHYLSDDAGEGGPDYAGEELPVADSLKY